jgi:2-methylcitrate dehydratase PrpD
VMLVTAIKDPKTGLEGKFSVYHAAAVALVDGAAGEQQFSDESVRVPTIVELRKRVVPTVDPTVGRDQARVTVLLKNGERLGIFVEHAVGSVEKPMSDRQLEDKFRGLADGILPAGQTHELIDLCWRADTLANAGDIARKAGKT